MRVVFSYSEDYFMQLERLQLIVGNTTQSIRFLKPYFVTEDDHEKTEDILTKLMLEAPQNIFVLLAFDRADDTLVGFTIAFISVDGNCYSQQTWSKDRLASRILFHKVINWAMFKGCKKISMFTTRRGDAMARITGMKVIGTVLATELTDDFERSFLLKVNKEIQNGQEGWRTAELHTDNLSNKGSTEGVVDPGGLLQQHSAESGGSTDQELSQGERAPSNEPVHQRDE